MKSPAVTFWTLGFEAFPNSLTFPAEGDTKYTGFLYSPEDITGWEITSKPSWCNITMEGFKSFAVTVDASTETRSGTITAIAHSNALGTLTENISVTQLGENSWEWDGTSWLFTGMVTINDYEDGQYYGSGEYECTLTVNSVANNDILINFIVGNSGEQDITWQDVILWYSSSDYSENCVIDENGNLVYTATLNVEGGSIPVCQVTIVRASSTTATADFYSVILGGDGGFTLSGLLQGTLTNP